MPLAEAFAHAQTTILGIQARIVANISTLVIADVRFVQTNLGPQRTGDVVLVVDGDTYVIHFTLTEESIDHRTVQGYTKQPNPDTGR